MKSGAYEGSCRNSWGQAIIRDLVAHLSCENEFFLGDYFIPAADNMAWVAVSTDCLIGSRLSRAYIFVASTDL